MTYVFYDIVQTETVIYETNFNRDLNYLHYVSTGFFLSVSQTCLTSKIRLKHDYMKE